MAELSEAVAKVGDELEQQRLPVWTARLKTPAETLRTRLESAMERLTTTRPFRAMIQPRPMTPMAQTRLALIAKRDKEFAEAVDVAVEKFQAQVTEAIQKSVHECFEWAFLAFGAAVKKSVEQSGIEVAVNLLDAEKKIVEQLRADNGLTAEDNVFITLEGTEIRLIGIVLSAVAKKPTLDMTRAEIRFGFDSLVNGLHGRLEGILQGFVVAAYHQASREIFAHGKLARVA